MVVTLGSALAFLALQVATPAPTPEYGLPLKGQAAEEFLRTAKVVKLAYYDKVAITDPRVAVLTDGERTHRAQFKDIHQEKRVADLQGGRTYINFKDSYRHEIAAYELDKLLGLDIVPPCVRRRVRGEVGSLCLWIEGTMTEWDRRMVKKIIPPDAASWNDQASTIRLFQELIYDIDYQNLRNLLVDPEFKVYKIDSGRAFRDDRKLRDEARLHRFSRSFLQALRRLDPEDVKKRLGPWLSPSQIKGLMARRDCILELAQKRVTEKGEVAVLYR
jgi:hypothetical protein